MKRLPIKFEKECLEPIEIYWDEFQTLYYHIVVYYDKVSTGENKAVKISEEELAFRGLKALKENLKDYENIKLIFDKQDDLKWELEKLKEELNERTNIRM